MDRISRSRFALGSYHYLRYPMEYFLDTAVELGIENVELWAAAPQLFLQLMGGLNGFFAPFYRYVHQHTSTRVVRGIASRRSPQVSKISSPSGKRCGRLTK